MGRLTFSYDPCTDVLTIEGFEYTGALFRDLAKAINLGEPFMIVSREDGVITLRSFAPGSTVMEPPPLDIRSPNIQITTIPHAAQRYNDVGDWFRRGGTTHITVSELGNEAYELLITIHELVEYCLCALWSVTDEEIVAWDVAWNQKPHPRGAEAGNDAQCPYHWPHVAAGIVERFMAFVMRVDYPAYDDAVTRVHEQRK